MVEFLRPAASGDIYVDSALAPHALAPGDSVSLRRNALEHAPRPPNVHGPVAARRGVRVTPVALGRPLENARRIYGHDDGVAPSVKELLVAEVEVDPTRAVEHGSRGVVARFFRRLECAIRTDMTIRDLS